MALHTHRRTIATAALACLVVAIPSLNACGSSSSTTQSSKTIAISFPNYSKEAAVQVEIKAAKARAAELGYRLVLDDPGSDIDKQVSTIKTWTPAHYAAIIAVALDPTVLNGIAKQVIDAGTKWITYGSTLQNQSGAVDMQQTAGGNTLGHLAAQWFNQNRKGTGTAAVLTYEAGEWARAREAALVDTLTKEAPGVRIVTRQDALSETEGLNATKTLLQAHPDINAILAIEETASVGAYAAVPDKNNPNLFIGGMDGTKEALNAIGEDGSYRGSAALDLPAIGTGMIDAAVAAATGKGSSTYKVTYVPVTPASPNLASMLKIWE
ncbi:MAG: sugar ABC transporter substrate-binding protein [Gordonia sp. (in: high G+C Gram-positive bacteria)]